MSSIAFLVVVACLVLLASNFVSKIAKRHWYHRYPPGPRGWPFIGIAFRLPSAKHWITYHRWAKEYGDVICFTSMRERTTVLNTARSAFDLFEARGAIYADRPSATMAGELVGWNKGLGYARLSPESPSSSQSTSEPAYPVHSHARFRVLRKLFQDVIGPRACQSAELIDLLERTRDDVLYRLAEKSRREPNGSDVSESIRQSTNAFILLLTYGYEISPHSDHDALIQIVEDAMNGFSRASEPGAYWVDHWSSLQYLPSWLPGTSFLHEATKMRADREKLYDVPFAWVKTQMAEGKATPSMISSLLSAATAETLEEDEELIKAVGASLYSGGAETTHSSVMSLLLAMVLHPAVQRRAQAELDALLGAPIAARRPSIQDRTRLPYVNAIVKEIWRWNPSVPLGMAHRVIQDDIYDGMFIEKGTTVYANIWAILHDEETFPDPFSFSPERYLDRDGKLKPLGRAEDPSLLAFGFGRRICPGLHLADSSLFLYVASILQAFTIDKARDIAGAEIEPEVDYEGFISYPKPFSCRVVSRSSSI